MGQAQRRSVVLAFSSFPETSPPQPGAHRLCMAAAVAGTPPSHCPYASLSSISPSSPRSSSSSISSSSPRRIGNPSPSQLTAAGTATHLSVQSDTAPLPGAVRSVRGATRRSNASHDAACPGFPWCMLLGVNQRQATMALVGPARRDQGHPHWIARQDAEKLWWCLSDASQPQP